MTGDKREDVAAERQGLAAERTSLARGRTSLAMLAAGAAVIKGIPEVTGHSPRPVVGSVIVALAVVLWLMSAWSERQRRSAIARGQLTAEPAWVLRTALISVVVGLAAFAVSFSA